MAMQSQPYLLIDPVGDHVRPVSSEAFTWVAAPTDRVLARNCVALFLGPSGVVSRIETIKVTRPGPATLVKLLLGRRCPAKLGFTEVQAELEDVRSMIWDARTIMIRNRLTHRDWWLFQAPEGQVRAALAAANTLSELYAAISFPTEQHHMGLL